MQLNLVTNTENLEGTLYYEFYPGLWTEEHWNPASVYVHDDAFTLISQVFRNRIHLFDPYGISKISGSRVTSVIEGLDEFAKTVSGTEKPENLWHGELEADILEQIDDWNLARRELSVMLRRLGQWMLGVQAKKQPITIIGL
ncbi:MAG: hypothetical protein OXR03_17395 [Rhodospirillaceae bacterium]|nr:hypothetical protein [Rhodospirillaceae bacterium]